MVVLRDHFPLLLGFHVPKHRSPTDKWYHRLVDKLGLATISVLGPDFLFGIAYGQFSSARRSVRAFARDSHLCNGAKWTYTHAFFADMGGMHLTSPDYPGGFPINAKQLHYLVTRKFVAFPDMNKMEIAERNTVDTLSRVITVFQAFWFFVTEIQRVRIGLPMTTLELTALSFSFIMFATSIAWFAKPTISHPRPIRTEHDTTVEDIRAFARRELSDTWYRTPLDFVGRDHFRINAHWNYYVRLTHLARIHLISRPVTHRPWDRFPSDTWLCADLVFTPLAFVVQLGFSISFLLAWNFSFPTQVEQHLWRISTAYHTSFSLYGGAYYLIEQIHSKRHWDSDGAVRPSSGSPHPAQGVESRRRPGNRLRQLQGHWTTCLRTLRNLSPDQDPDMEVPLRIIVPVTATCAFYVFCRVYIYFEDFFSLRAQPAGVFLTVNKFVPFLVGPN